MRSVMRACIGSNRAPDGRYAEIDLPASPYRLLNALDEIGIKSTKEIVYQEILNYGSFGYLEPHFDEYTMLEELNALAQKLAVFDRVDSIAFEGLVKMAEQKPEPFGVKELINFAHSTESCHVVSDVFDDEQLGRFYAGKGFMPEYETLPDKIYEHLDFAKIGREARESEGGVFTQRGYRRCTWTSHGQCRIVWRCINRLDYGKKYCLMDEYDTIFVEFPIWWYIAPTIVNAFLESYDLTGKTIIPFATSGGSGMGKTNEALKPSCTGATLLEGKVWKSTAKKEELSVWADSLACR